MVWGPGGPGSMLFKSRVWFNWFSASNGPPEQLERVRLQWFKQVIKLHDSKEIPIGTYYDITHKNYKLLNHLISELTMKDDPMTFPNS